MSKKDNKAKTVGSEAAITSRKGGVTAANSNIYSKTTATQLAVVATPFGVAGALLGLLFDDKKRGSRVK